MNRAWIAAVAFVSACSVQINNYDGRACDQNHACVDGWVCVAGTCQPPPDGGTDGGAIWRQWVEGFASTTISPAGCCALDAGIPADGHTVTDKNPAGGGTGFANGSFNMSAGRGQIRGHIHVTSLPYTLAHVVDVPNLVTINVLSGGSLQVLSPPGALATNQVGETVTNQIQGGTDYLIEVAWDRTSFLTTSLDGQQIATQALSGQGVTSAINSVSLGLSSEDGGISTDSTVTLWRWQIGPDPSVTLTE